MLELMGVGWVLVVIGLIVAFFIILINFIK